MIKKKAGKKNKKTRKHFFVSINKETDK